MLAIFDQNLPLKLDCDASQHGLGTLLSNVYTDKSERTIAYASRALNKHELSYSQIHKQGASIIILLKWISQNLFRNYFFLTTDNKAIQKIFDSKTGANPIAARRLLRWSLILAQHDHELKSRSSKEYCNPDMLSKLPTSLNNESPVKNLI